MTAEGAKPGEGRDESGQRRSGEIRRTRAGVVGEDGRNGNGELRRTRPEVAGDEGRSINGYRNRSGIRAEQVDGCKEIEESRRMKTSSNTDMDDDRNAVESHRAGKRIDQDAKTVKYYPRHSPPKVHKPYEREASMVDEQGKDVVVALRAKDNQPRRVVELKSRLPTKDDHASRDESTLGKRKLTTKGSPVENKATKKVSFQEPLTSPSVNKQVPSLVVKSNHTRSETNDAKAMPEKVTDDVIQITLGNQTHAITDEVLARIEATTTDEDFGNLDPYGDLVDYELDSFPNISQAVTTDDVQREPAGTNVVTQPILAQPILTYDKSSGGEERVSIVEGYPFRYNMSEKAQKQINNIMYVDVAEAVRKLQRTLNQVVKERDDFEKQWKDATRIAETDTNHLQQVGDLEKEVAELKRLHFEDHDMFEYEIEQYKRRAKLAVEEMKKEQDAKFELSAELQDREALVASVREQMKEVIGRNEELRNFVEAQNLKIPAELLTTVPKNRYGW